MNGTVTEKEFAGYTQDQREWLIFNTMQTRDTAFKKHCTRLYAAIIVLSVAIAAFHGPSAVMAMIRAVVP